MSEEKRVRYFVRNHKNQPVELHLSTGVVVLGPYAEAEVAKGDLSEPQMKVFVKQRLVTTREAVALDKEPEEEVKEVEEVEEVEQEQEPEPAAAAPKSRGKAAKTRDEQGGRK